MRFIKKIKQDTKGRLIFGYVEKADGGMKSEHVAKYTEPPQPELTLALEELDAHMVDFIELPEDDDYISRINVSEVDFSYDDMDEGKDVKMTADLAVPAVSATVSVTSPTYKVPKSLEEKEFGGEFLSKEELTAFANLLKEADRYLNGHRAQGSLFDDPQEGDGKSLQTVNEGESA